MTTDNDEAEKKLAAMKREMAKKKAKLAVPAEFLDNAKSYDDKVTLVKILTEKEKNRVVLMFKKMIQSGIAEANQKKGLK